VHSSTLAASSESTHSLIPCLVWAYGRYMYKELRQKPFANVLWPGLWRKGPAWSKWFLLWHCPNSSFSYGCCNVHLLRCPVWLSLLIDRPAHEFFTPMETSLLPIEHRKI
jgi:hypothetical protein